MLIVLESLASNILYLLFWFILIIKIQRKMREKNKELQMMADKYTELNIYGDVNEIIQERDKYAKYHKEQVKIANDIKIAMDAQKRLLQRSTKNLQSGYMRPATSGNF